MSLKKISWWINFFFQDYCILCLKVILQHSICLRHYFLWQVLWCLYQFWNSTNPKICIPDQLQLWQLKHLMSRERVNIQKKYWTHIFRNLKSIYVSDFFCTDFKKGLIFLKNRNVCISLKNKLYFCHSLKKMKVILLRKKEHVCLYLFPLQNHYFTRIL